MKTTVIGLVIGLASGVCVLGDTVAPSDLDGATVSYAHLSELKVFPAPSVVYQRGGLVSKQERTRLRDALVIPVIRSSTKPISVVVVEIFTPHTSEVGLTVYWSDGTWLAQNLKTVDGRPVEYATYQAALKDFEESTRCED